MAPTDHHSHRSNAHHPAAQRAASDVRQWVIAGPHQKCQKLPFGLFCGESSYLQRLLDALLAFSYLGQSLPHGQLVENETSAKHKAALSSAAQSLHTSVAPIIEHTSSHTQLHKAQGPTWRNPGGKAVSLCCHMRSHNVQTPQLQKNRTSLPAPHPDGVYMANWQAHVLETRMHDQLL